MATLIPARGICRPRMTAGERRFADRLEDTLEKCRLSFASVGIRLRGHAAIPLAHAFTDAPFDADSGGGDMPTLITPESVGRPDPTPQLTCCGTRTEEADTLIKHVRNDDCSLNQIAIWRDQRDAYGIGRQLQMRGLPVACPTTTAQFVGTT